MTTEVVLAHEVHKQDTGFWCGPASVRTLLSIHGIVVAESVLAAEMGTTINGTNREPIMRALNRRLDYAYSQVAIPSAFATAAQRDALWANLVESIDAGHGIIANVVGRAIDVSGVSHSYAGHYVPVVGYRRGVTDQALISDVAIGRDYWMTLERLANWCGERGYVHAAAASDDEGMDMTKQEIIDAVLAALATPAPYASSGSGKRLREAGWAEVSMRAAVDYSMELAVSRTDDIWRAKVDMALAAIVARLDALVENHDDVAELGEIAGQPQPSVDEIASAVAAKLAELLGSMRVEVPATLLRPMLRSS